MSDLLSLITVRKAVPSDHPFIYNSWIRSAADGRPKNERYKDYCSRQHAVIEGHLERGTTLVACDVEDHDMIYGYILFDEQDFHWIYVKDVYRRNGVALSLLNESLRIARPQTSPGNLGDPQGHSRIPRTYTYSGRFNLWEHYGIRQRS